MHFTRAPTEKKIRSEQLPLPVCRLCWLKTRPFQSVTRLQMRIWGMEERLNLIALSLRLMIQVTKTKWPRVIPVHWVQSHEQREQEITLEDLTLTQARAQVLIIILINQIHTRLIKMLKMRAKTQLVASWSLHRHLLPRRLRRLHHHRKGLHRTTAICSIHGTFLALVLIDTFCPRRTHCPVRPLQLGLITRRA